MGESGAQGVAEGWRSFHCRAPNSGIYTPSYTFLLRYFITIAECPVLNMNDNQPFLLIITLLYCCKWSPVGQLFATKTIIVVPVGTTIIHVQGISSTDTLYTHNIPEPSSGGLGVVGPLLAAGLEVSPDHQPLCSDTWRGRAALGPPWLAVQPCSDQVFALNRMDENQPDISKLELNSPAKAMGMFYDLVYKYRTNGALSLIHFQSMVYVYVLSRALPTVWRANRKSMKITSSEAVILLIVMTTTVTNVLAVLLILGLHISARVSGDWLNSLVSNQYYFTEEVAEEEMGESEENALLTGDDTVVQPIVILVTEEPAPIPVVLAPTTATNTTNPRTHPKRPKQPKSEERRNKERQKQKEKRKRKHEATRALELSSSSFLSATGAADAASSSTLTHGPDLGSSVTQGLAPGSKPPKNKHRVTKGAQNSTQQSPKSIAAVFGKGVATHSLTITKAGASDMDGAVKLALFSCDGDYKISSFRSTGVGQAALDCHGEESVREVTRCLSDQGFVVLPPTPVWERFVFIVPACLSSLPAPVFVANLQKRNRQYGLPLCSLRMVSRQAEGNGGSRGGPSRIRIWVDVSPEAIQFLREHDYLLETGMAAVRLKPAPRDRHTSNNS